MKYDLSYDEITLIATALADLADAASDRHDHATRLRMQREARAALSRSTQATALRKRLLREREG